MMRTFARASAAVLATLVVCTVTAGESPGSLAGKSAAASQSAGTPLRVDPADLDRIEELSESLANDLLALSVATRDRDLRRMAEHVSERLIATGWPTRPGPLRPRARWAQQHDWTGGGEAAEQERARFLEGLAALLEHFSVIEDVRFKVKQADFAADSEAGAQGEARVWWFVVGRDEEGRREWLTAWLRIVAARAADVGPETARGGSSGAAEPVGTDASPADVPWQILRLEIESIESMVAERDLFSEVAVPAGLAAAFPPFGTPPNDAVTAHGAAVADVNGDGLLDLLTTGVERNALYLNDGRGGFTDVSDVSLVGLAPAGSGAAFLDADNDGDQDIFMSRIGAQVYLENRLVPDGELRFIDRSLSAGVEVDAIGFSVAVADVNGDGWPDVYVASYNRYGLVMPDHWHRASNGTPNLLFINRGDGTFREAGAAWGVRDSRWSYAASFADVDGDGDQDLYVANDFGENGFYLNDGTAFRDVAHERGLQDPGNGMGVAFGDFDNDGDLDLHVTNMSSTAGNRILGRLMPDASPDSSVLKKLAAGNTLFENRGDGTFRDVSTEVGGLAAGWAWGGGFIDFDNDGWEDLYAPNGFISGKTMNDT